MALAFIIDLLKIALTIWLNAFLWVITSVVCAKIARWFHRSNCLFYAVKKFFDEGGFLITEWSKNYPGPHFSHTHDLKSFTEYGPAKTPYVLFPPTVFKGSVKTKTIDDKLGP